MPTNKPIGVIAMLTDMGLSDYFVASMKGVIASINKELRVIDITHEAPSFNVTKASFILWRAYKWFPAGTVFLVVVDPGVGTKRRGLVIETKSYWFVGPDNGVLSPAAEEDGVRRVYGIREDLFKNASSTFHGRDIFAPVAARIASGEPPSLMCEEVGGFRSLRLLEYSLRGGVIKARIVYIDKFGNCYTSYTGAPPAPYGSTLTVKLPSTRLAVRFVRSYGFVEPGEPLALINSEGHLELAVREGSFATRYGLREGVEVEITTS